MAEEKTTKRGNEQGSLALAEIVSTLWDSRKLIGYVAGGATILSAIVSLLMSDYYRSTVILLPETEKSRLGSLGGISDLAALAGVNAGDGSLVKLYPTIIKSESVLRNVIYSKYHSEQFKDSVDLLKFWDIEGSSPERLFESGMKTLRDQAEVSLDVKTNVVTITIETPEAQVSADIVNKIATELDRFIRTKKTTNASRQRQWIEARLVEVKGDLERSENLLKEFREKNRRVLDSPKLMLEQERLVREVQINSSLYAELKKQYEIVKIEEIKNIPIINILDPGRAAARKARPIRRNIVLGSFFFSIIAAGGLAISRKRYGAQYAEVERWFGALRSKIGRRS